MINWLEKFYTNTKEKKTDNKVIKPIDSLEDALWDIKEDYDLETEEIEKTVLNKRKNIEFMYNSIKQKINGAT
jgi:uncharacterized membrane protein|tara:strand:- start:287 stop:505 length:219 start_codon:yes stop_codon:yes gene_type:complete